MFLALAVSGGISGMASIICMIIALVLFFIAAIWRTVNAAAPVPWYRIMAAALFFWCLAQFIIMVGGL